MSFDVIGTARRRTRRLVLTALVVLILAAGLVYAAGLYANARLDDPPGPPAPATVAVPWPADTDAAPGGAALPPDVGWVRLSGVDLPVSTGTGPAEMVGGLARGFARTRAGAAVAAMHLLVRTTVQVGPRVFDPTFDEQVVGEHAAAMRVVVGDGYRQAAARAGIVYGQPLDDLPAALVGVRVDSYTAARADLSVLTSASDTAGVTRYAATTVTVVWAGGDWRLLAPPGGRWDGQVRIVDASTVGGFTPLRAR